MLPRELEPEVMDTREEAQAYDAMDHASVNRLFVADFLTAWNGRNPILDVGTGTAQIPIELSRQTAEVEIVAIDLAEQMLEVARANLTRAGLQARVRVERQDAKQLTYARGSFGAVISNSIVHHIPEPGRVLAEVCRVLSPGGTLFIRDLLRPASEVDVERLVAAYAGEATPTQQQMFRDSLRAALTLDEVRDLVRSCGADLMTVRQTSDRHWTWQWSLPG